MSHERYKRFMATEQDFMQEINGKFASALEDFRADDGNTEELDASITRMIVLCNQMRSGIKRENICPSPRKWIDSRTLIISFLQKENANMISLEHLQSLLYDLLNKLVDTKTLGKYNISLLDCYDIDFDVSRNSLEQISAYEEDKFGYDPVTKTLYLQDNVDLNALAKKTSVVVDETLSSIMDAVVEESGEYENEQR